MTEGFPKNNIEAASEEPTQVEKVEAAEWLGLSLEASSTDYQTAWSDKIAYYREHSHTDALDAAPTGFEKVMAGKGVLV